MLTATADVLRSGGEDRLEAFIRTVRDRSLEGPARVKVITPRELEVLDSERLVELSPDRETHLVFHLKNQNGRLGAVYPLVVMASGVAEGRRVLAAVSADAAIARPKYFFKEYQPGLILAAGILSAFVLFIQVFGRRSPKRRTV